jgi:hypothetical protein
MIEINTTMIGFLLGVVGSWLFWRYMLFLKPKVKISKYILRGPNRRNPDSNRPIFRIKVVNTGRRQIVGLEARATIGEITGNTEGIDRRRVTKKILPLNSHEVPALGPKRNVGNSWSLRPLIVFWTDEDIDALLTEGGERRVVFTLFATDAESGTTKVFQQIYEKQLIKDGDFAVGIDCDKIEPLVVASRN